MNEKIEDLDKRGYRKFGLLTGAILAGLFGLIIPYLLSHGYPKWPWIIAATLAVFALAAPMALKHPYRLWMRFGLVMNWINTRLILGLLFYGLFFPMAMLFKLMGKDPMQRKLSKSVSTYRVQNEFESKNNLEEPY